MPIITEPPPTPEKARQGVGLKRQMWPSTWYVLRRSSEVAPGAVVPIKALDMDLIICRTPEGRISVMDGHCTHRGASLGHGGSIERDPKGDACIQCPFHGFLYNMDGKCTHIPGIDHIPKAARLKTWPVAESLGMIWMWYGPEPLFPPPSLEGCGVVSEVGNKGRGTLDMLYGFRNTRNCLMRDSICGSLDYMHGNLVHGLESTVRSLEHPTWYKLVSTLDVKYLPTSLGNKFRIFYVGTKITYKGQYYGPSVVYTRSFGEKRELLGHIRCCLPISENRTQTDFLLVVRKRPLTGRPPLIGTQVRLAFARHQDDEDVFLDQQKPRAMYMKNFDEGMIAHHRMCMRMGQNVYEGNEPTYDMDAEGNLAMVQV